MKLTSQKWLTLILMFTLNFVSNIGAKPLTYAQALALGQEQLKNYDKAHYEYFLDIFKARIANAKNSLIEESQVKAIIKSIAQDPFNKKLNAAAQSASAYASQTAAARQPAVPAHKPQFNTDPRRATTAIQAMARQNIVATFLPKSNPNTPAKDVKPTAAGLSAAAAPTLVPPYTIELRLEGDPEPEVVQENNKQLVLKILKGQAQDYNAVRDQWNPRYKVDLNEIPAQLKQANQAHLFLLIQDLNTPFDFADLQFIPLTQAQINILQTFDAEHWQAYLEGFQCLNEDNVFYLYNFYRFAGFLQYIENLTDFNKSIIVSQLEIEESFKSKDQELFKKLQAIKVPTKAPLVRTGFPNPSVVNYVKQKYDQLAKKPEFLKIKKELDDQNAQFNKAQAKISSIRAQQKQELNKFQEEMLKQQAANTAVFHNVLACANKDGGPDQCKEIIRNNLDTKKGRSATLQARIDALKKAKESNFYVKSIEPSASIGLLIPEAFIGDDIQYNQYLQNIEQLSRARRIAARNRSNKFMQGILNKAHAHGQYATNKMLEGAIKETYENIDYAKLINDYAKQLEIHHCDYNAQFTSNESAFIALAESYREDLKLNQEYLDHSRKELDQTGCRQLCTAGCPTPDVHENMRRDVKYADVLNERLTAIQETFHGSKPHDVMLQPFALTDATKKLFQQANSLVDVNSHAIFCGNAIQREAYQEVVNLLNKISFFDTQNQLNVYFNELCISLNKLSKIAFSAINRGYVEVAFDIVDNGNAMLEYGKIASDRLMRKAQELKDLGVEVIDAAMHPIRTATRMCNALLPLYRMATGKDTDDYKGDFKSLNALVKDPAELKAYQEGIKNLQMHGHSNVDIETYLGRSVAFTEKLKATIECIEQLGNDVLALTEKEMFAHGVDFVLDCFLWHTIIRGTLTAVELGKKGLRKACDKIAAKGGKAVATEVAATMQNAERSAAKLPGIIAEEQNAIGQAITTGLEFERDFLELAKVPAAKTPLRSSTFTDELLKEHTRQLKRYGDLGFRELENGKRIRYYFDFKKSKKPGKMIGTRRVREWTPDTGKKRTWIETLDINGKIRQIRLEHSENEIKIMKIAGKEIKKKHFFFNENGGFSHIWESNYEN